MSKMQKLSSGWATWRWLSGVSQKEKQWLIGTIRSRNGYQSWMVHLSEGLRDGDFLLAFEKTADPWQRSRLVGEKISALRQSFMKLTSDQRAELAKQGEAELKTGLELLGRDKQTIQQLIELVDPPPNQ
jgi:hypothetical protein